jgi:hypothetical protein
MEVLPGLMSPALNRQALKTGITERIEQMTSSLMFKKRILPADILNWVTRRRKEG